MKCGIELVIVIASSPTDLAPLQRCDEFVPRRCLQGLGGAVSVAADDQRRPLKLFQIVRLNYVDDVEATECQHLRVSYCCAIRHGSHSEADGRAPSGAVAARPGVAEVPIAPADWTGAVGQVSGIDASGQ